MCRRLKRYLAEEVKGLRDMPYPGVPHSTLGGALGRLSPRLLRPALAAGELGDP